MLQEDEEVRLLVFQCSKCQAIVGDSLRLEAADEEIQVILLKGTSGVTVSPDTSISTSGRDAGSSYKSLRCAGCGAVLGKSYIATPRRLDRIRDCFALDSNCISSYELGTSDLLASTSPVPQSEISFVNGAHSSTSSYSTAACSAGHMNTGSPNKIQPLDSQEASSCDGCTWGSIEKLERMVLVLHDRITVLEESQSQNGNEKRSHMEESQTEESEDTRNDAKRPRHGT